MLSRPSKIRYVEEGEGGTFTFKNKVPDDASDKEKRELIPYIGLWGCRSCVGVYFKVDNDRCFLAHINPYLYIHNEGGKDHREWIVTFEQGIEVKQAVLQRLQKEAHKEGWSPNNPRIRETIVLVCPYPETDPLDLEEPSKFWGSDPGDDRIFRVGHYVIEALQEFLQDPRLEPDTDSEGFVVEWETGKRRMIKIDNSRKHELYNGPAPQEVRDSEVVPEEDADEDWEFGFEVEEEEEDEDGEASDREEDDEESSNEDSAGRRKRAAGRE